MTQDEQEYLDIVDTYMNGYCMFMAAALHQAYGFPIGLMSIWYKDVGERLCHAWVNLPNGKYLDIQGEQTLKEVTSFSEDGPRHLYKIYSSTTLAHLEQLANTKLPFDDKEVVAALAVAKKLNLVEFY